MIIKVRSASWASCLLLMSSSSHPSVVCYCWVTSVVSDSVRPQRWQPTRLPRPWDSPGKNTGVGCHFLLQSMKVKSESEVAQSCPTLSNTMDYSLPGSSIHGISQARVLEWGAIAFSEEVWRRCQNYWWDFQWAFNSCKSEARVSLFLYLYKMKLTMFLDYILHSSKWYSCCCCC